MLYFIEKSLDNRYKHFMENKDKKPEEREYSIQNKTNALLGPYNTIAPLVGEIIKFRHKIGRGGNIYYIIEGKVHEKNSSHDGSVINYSIVSVKDNLFYHKIWTKENGLSED
jgi:hypothetical protein